MNGRVYDPVLGRFMSADPNVQSPTHTQSFNRYAYVMNNPLNATDPTGFEWWGETDEQRGYTYSWQSDVEGYGTLTFTAILPFNRFIQNPAVTAAQPVISGTEQKNSSIAGSVNGGRDDSSGLYGSGLDGSPDRNPGAQPSAVKSNINPNGESHTGTNLGITGSSGIKLGLDLGDAGPAVGAVATGLCSALEPCGVTEITTALAVGLAAQMVINRSISKAQVQSNDKETQYVVRGGSCYKKLFCNGTGVKMRSDGTLFDVSVQSYPGKSIQELSQRQWIPQNQIGVITLQQLEQAGGRLTPSSTNNNPYHADIDGLTGAQLESLFRPTMQDPNPNIGR